MTGRVEPYRSEYVATLQSHLIAGNELARNHAYELGRRALADGLGVLDMAALHRAGIETLVLAAPADEQPRLAAAAADLFDELLSPFEMSGRAAQLELQRANESLRQQRDAVETVNRELESFSYSVSHDLRAPLRSIDGFSQILLEESADKLDEDGRRHLRRVREAAQQMGELIEALLSLARITRSELHRVDVDLSAIVHRIAARLRSSQERDVRFVIQDGVRASGDERLLGVLLENLIGNAWKFTSKRESAEITFASQTQGATSVYRVEDNGVGFDMSHAAKLFGAFQRFHAATDFEGNGVGLAIVQRVVHRHDGRVWAEGEVGRGATFQFTLEGGADGVAVRAPGGAP